MEAFQLSVGRQRDPDLSAFTMTSPIADRGRQLFLTETSTPGVQPAAKCTSCHNNGGANASPLMLSSNGFPPGEFNLTLQIGTSELNGGFAEMVDPGNVPVDGGFGRDPHVTLGGFGTHAFNVQPLIEAPDTGPYFHDNSVMLLENVIEFYLGGEFNGSDGVQLLENVDNPPGFGILTTSVNENAAVGAFLRVANTVENCRSSKFYMQRLKTWQVQNDFRTHQRLLAAALNDLQDGQDVLSAALLHPEVVDKLALAQSRLEQSDGYNSYLIDQAITQVNLARRMLFE